MSVNIHTYIYIYIYIDICIYIYMYTYISLHTYIHIYLYVFTHIYIYLYSYLYVRMHAGSMTLEAPTDQASSSGATGTKSLPVLGFEGLNQSYRVQVQKVLAESFDRKFWLLTFG